MKISVKLSVLQVINHQKDRSLSEECIALEAPCDLKIKELKKECSRKSFTKTVTRAEDYCPHFHTGKLVWQQSAECNILVYCTNNSEPV
jgi:hypothetical protein